MRSLMNKYYPESRFGGFTNIDGTISFFTRVNALIAPTSVILDVGCGRGEYAEDPLPLRAALRNLRGKGAKVIGLDVDQAASANPCLDEFVLLEGNSWPIPSNSVDLIVCDHLLEHVDDPKALFSECSRVLKTGGVLCARTPNKWSYVALAAMIIPNQHHAKVTSYVQDKRQEQDVFPTRYRCNTVGALKKLMQAHDLDGVTVRYEAEPSYFSFSSILYLLGYLHQRFIPRFFSPILFLFAEKLGDNNEG